MALIFMLLSLLVSALNEVVLGHLARWRSHVLREGIRSLLTGQHPSGRTSSRIVAAIGSCIAMKLRGPEQPDGKAPADGGDLKKQPEGQAPSPSPTTACIADELFASPLIRGLSPPGGPSPNYIPPETFADALLAVLQSRGILASTDSKESVAHATTDRFTRNLVNALLPESASMPQKRERLILWFNQSMEIVGGTYRRQAQFCMHIWAALLVLTLNVDAIGLSQRLMADKTLRKALVTFADKTVADRTVAPPRATNTPPPIPSKTFDEIRTNMVQLGIPLGWNWGYETNQADPLQVGTAADARLLAKPTLGWGFFLKALGLLLSIAAVSQGAPFWFDVLNRLTNLRSANKPAPPKPAEAT